jgi:hypothetical protein
MQTVSVRCGGYVYAGLGTAVVIPGEGEAEIGAEGIPISAKIASQMETTGQSVVLDDVTKEVIHVGGPGFTYGPGSEDLP